MAKKHAERQIVVARPPQECFDALVDFEAYPRWMPGKMASALNDQVMLRSVEDLKAQVESGA